MVIQQLIMNLLRGKIADDGEEYTERYTEIVLIAEILAEALKQIESGNAADPLVIAVDKLPAYKYYHRKQGKQLDLLDREFNHLFEDLGSLGGLFGRVEGGSSYRRGIKISSPSVVFLFLSTPQVYCKLKPLIEELALLSRQQQECESTLVTITAAHQSAQKEQKTLQENIRSIQNKIRQFNIFIKRIQQVLVQQKDKHSQLNAARENYVNLLTQLEQELKPLREGGCGALLTIAICEALLSSKLAFDYTGSQARGGHAKKIVDTFVAHSPVSITTSSIAEPSIMQLLIQQQSEFYRLEIKKATETIAKLRSDIAAAQAALDSTLSENTELERDLIKHKKELAPIEEEYSRLQEEYAKREKANVELAAEIRRFRSESHEKLEEFRKLWPQKQLSVIHGKIGSSVAISELLSLHADLALLQNELNKQLSKYRELEPREIEALLDNCRTPLDVSDFFSAGFLSAVRNK